MARLPKTPGTVLSTWRPLPVLPEGLSARGLHHPSYSPLLKVLLRGDLKDEAIPSADSITFLIIFKNNEPGDFQGCYFESPVKNLREAHSAFRTTHN